MLKPLTRDILVTLIIKFTLLILLWLICFKNTGKPYLNTEQWLLGSVQKNNVPYSEK
ncbi:MAG: cytochrome oxidase putative small subunit CydP [Legionella sp.]